MALEITYNNFEISLVVFMPNIPTNHAITYTNPFHPSVFLLAGLEIWFRSAKLNKNYLTSYPDITIGTSRSNGVTATRTSLKKSLQRLFLPTYFVNCRRTLLKLNFKGPNSSSEREIKFLCRLFTSSIKHKIRNFHVVVM